MPTNSSGRTTRQIGQRHAENAFHATRYAADMSRPLNTQVTINFSDIGIAEHDARAVFTQVYARVTRWWRHERKKGTINEPFSSYYAHANPHGRRHVHWIVRVPKGVPGKFEHVVRDRLKKVVGHQSADDAILISDVGNAGTLAKYVLRGVDPRFADYFKMWASDEGVISGRRTGVSRSIGRSARRTACW